MPSIVLRFLALIVDVVQRSVKPWAAGCLCGLVLLVSGQLQAATGTTYVNTTPVPTSSATLTLNVWIPPSVTTVRGAIVMVHGDDDHYDYTVLEGWKTLAQRHAFAYVVEKWPNSQGLASNPNPTDTINDQIATNNGLTAIGNANGHPELATAPIAIWGFSAGGRHAVNYAQRFPDRCIAFCHKDGASISGVSFTQQVPGLLSYSELYGAESIIRGQFNQFRGNGALVALVPDWGINHLPTGYGSTLGIAYFDQIIEMRLPTSFCPGTTATLTSLDENSGWLGDTVTSTTDVNGRVIEAHTTFIKRSDFTGTNAEALTKSWLPNVFLANAWRSAASMGYFSSSTTYPWGPGVGGPAGSGDISTASPSFIDIYGNTTALFTGSTTVTWYDGDRVEAGGSTAGAGPKPNRIRWTPKQGIHCFYPKIASASLTEVNGFSLICINKPASSEPVLGGGGQITVSPATPRATQSITLGITATPGDGGMPQLLTSTWSITGTPPGTPVFSTTNGSNAASSITVTFPIAGTYTVQVVVKNPEGDQVTQTKTITVAVPPPPVITTTTLPNGVVGTMYDQTLSSSDPNASWSLASGSFLPAGWTLSTTGEIKGMPTAATTISFTVTAQNAGGISQGQNLSIQILPATPVITTTALPNGVVGTMYDQTLTSSDPNASWTITDGSLPTGWILTDGGEIKGMPTTVTTIAFTVTARNVTGTSLGQNLSFQILPVAPVIITTALPKGMVGTMYDQILSSSDPNASWTITGGILPAGWTLTNAGEIKGMPTEVTTIDFTVTARNAGGSSLGQYLSFLILPAAPVISTSILPNGVVGTMYDQTLTSSDPNALWAITIGSLPPGWTLTTTGEIKGMPTAATTITFTVTASNAGGTSAGKELSIIVTPPKPIIITTSLPSGTVGVGYHQLLSAQNTPAIWAITGGSLPDGLALASDTGIISGTPSSAKGALFTVTASNAGGFASVSLSIAIVPAPGTDGPAPVAGGDLGGGSGGGCGAGAVVGLLGMILMGFGVRLRHRNDEATR